MIKVDTKKAAEDLKSVFWGLSTQNVKNATSRAINHVLGTSRTAMSNEIRSVYNIKAGDVKELTDITKATGNSQTGMIMSSGTPLSLSKFNPVSTQARKGGMLTQIKQYGGKKGGFASSLKTKSGWKTGVKVEIIKGKEETLPSAFIAGSGSGTVMARGEYGTGGFEWGKARLPIAKLNTKSVYWASMNDAVNSAVSKKTTVDYEKRVLHELTRSLDSGGRM
jgi:bifunctional DNA-binding transcriptional regulator/antitoxin component of YhaV-PrlF toxin-antitoxin module